MNSSTTNQSLVILNIPPSLEEPLIDWLLEDEHDSGFTSFPAHGHSTRHGHLSIGEQVSGRQQRVQVQVQMDSDAVDTFLQALELSLGKAGIHYWVLPVLRSGHFGVSE